MRYWRDVVDDKYARLRGDRPCKTIVAHLAKDDNGYIHPTQVRSLSFREAAPELPPHPVRPQYRPNGYTPVSRVYMARARTPMARETGAGTGGTPSRGSAASRRKLPPNQYLVKAEENDHDGRPREPRP